MNLLLNICIFVINLALMVIPCVTIQFAGMSYIYLHKVTLLTMMMLGGSLMILHVLYFIIAEIARRIRKML